MKNTIFTSLVLLITAGFLGCGHSEKHDHEHEAEHEHAIQLTAYADTMELYVEMTPLVAGNPSAITIHCTNTNTFKPLVAKTASVILSVNGKKTVAEAKSQVRPGVFSCSVTPQLAGAAELKITVNTSNGSVPFGFKGIQSFDDPEAAHDDAEKKEMKSGIAVAFPKELGWNMDFSTALVKRVNMGTVVRTVARILPSQGEETIVSAKVSGMVSLGSGSALAEGCAVRQGQTICQIDASATANDNLKVQYSQALAEYTKCRNEYDKLKELEADRLVTASQITEAKAALENAEARYNSLQKNFSSGKQLVTASRNGYLKELNVKDGEYVTVGQTVATIAQNRFLRLKAEVPASYYSDLRNIGEVVISSSDKSQTGMKLSSIGGHLISYGKQVSLENPLIPVIFEVDNVGSLLPGTFVDMYIHTGSGNVLAVPAMAVLEEMGNHFVYVQLNPELFEKRQVTIGSSDGIDTEIRSGLKENERVVAHGATLVKLQQTSGAVDPHSGHNH